MSNASNNQGRGYEYACINALHTEISKVRKAEIVQNSSLQAAKNVWDTLDSKTKESFQQSALAFIETLCELEPLILESNADTLTLLLQADSSGQEGDVRDVLIIRKGISWEIGLSIKHNHFAVKHSRLSKKLDFGKKWYKVPCSKDYWEDVAPIFNRLSKNKEDKMLWSSISNKDKEVYVPLLLAFKNEIERQNNTNKDIPKLMVEYLLGQYDFYKIIGLDSKKITQIHSYNLRGTLNKEGEKSKRTTNLPVSVLPTRIVSFDFKPNSTNTLEMYLDNGWQFNFRIHNAASKVEPSLKFDIQVIGMPATITVFNCIWK